MTRQGSKLTAHWRRRSALEGCDQGWIADVRANRCRACYRAAALGLRFAASQNFCLKTAAAAFLPHASASNTLPGMALKRS